jgi:hypothetical protein
MLLILPHSRILFHGRISRDLPNPRDSRCTAIVSTSKWLTLGKALDVFASPGPRGSVLSALPLIIPGVPCGGPPQLPALWAEDGKRQGNSGGLLR